jgi:hypothetical protein
VEKERKVKFPAEAWKGRFSIIPEIFRSAAIAKELREYFQKEASISFDEFLADYFPEATEFQLIAIKAYIAANYSDSNTTMNLFKIWRDPMTSEELRKEIEDNLEHAKVIANDKNV